MKKDATKAVLYIASAFDLLLVVLTIDALSQGDYRLAILLGILIGVLTYNVYRVGKQVLKQEEKNEH